MQLSTTFKLCSWGAVMADLHSKSGFLKDFQIPNYILLTEPKDKDAYVPKCPVLVFINSKSGGQLGGDLLKTFRNLLNENQVAFTFLCSIRFGTNLTWPIPWIAYCLADFKVCLIQVFDLGEEAPDKVLSRIFLNLERLKNEGDDLAIIIQEKLRIIVSLLQ